MDKYTWATPILLSDGHRLFPDPDDPFKRVAIADESGREPQDTDDGILWLDMDRPLMILRNENKEAYSIPLLINGSGEPTRAITNASTLLYLAHTFKWPLVDTLENMIYKVEER